MTEDIFKVNLWTVVLFSSLAAFLIALISRRNESKKLPPGPYGLPFVGYLPFLATKPYDKLVELSKKYGSVFRLKLGSETVVMICDYATMKKVFHDDDTMGRPPDLFTGMTEETIALGAVNGYGWKEQKKYAMQMLRELGFGTSRVEAHIREEIEELLERITHTNSEPITPVEYFVPSAANNISSFMFGKRRRFDDPQRIFYDQLADQSRGLVRKAGALSFFPFLRDVSLKFNLGPLSKFLKIEAQRKEIYKQEIREHQATLDPTNVRDFIDGFMLEMEKKKNEPKTTFTPAVLEDVVSLFFGAGSEALRVALDWLILEVAAFPAVQKRVQAEIDAVIGRDRFPTRSDYLQMPFTEAVILENYRWRASLPINIPRFTLKDTEINSFFVPKGTQIIGIFWTINRDPALWGRDVDHFRPERFLSEDGTQVRKPEYLVPFSMGRRACPGEALANVIVFLYFTAVLQKFHVKLPDGVEANLVEDIAVGFQTKQNKLCFVPRH